MLEGGATGGLSWLGIVRLGLVQTSLGAIVVLTTSTLNRLMVVELALPAMVPGALIAIHHAMQLLRPRMGYGSDMHRRRTPWIIGGMVVLALGGLLASLATALMAVNLVAGLALAVIAFVAIGLGVSAAGTTLLVLLAKLTAKDRRAAAATTVWLMMIAGFAVTAVVTGKLLDPFSFDRLIAITAGVGAVAVAVTVIATYRIEESAGRLESPQFRETQEVKPKFKQAISEVWRDPQAKLLTVFIFVSMLAYSLQDLILEPFAGHLFAFSPGQSTALSGVQHGGAFVGMVLVGVAASLIGGRWLGSLKMWTVGGCAASALALVGIALSGFAGPEAPLRLFVGLLGVANGAFSIAAISTMMSMAGRGREGWEGTRMGLWGAAQGIAFGVGGFGGTILVDLARLLVGPIALAYALVFLFEAALFVWAAVLASRIVSSRTVVGQSVTGTDRRESPRKEIMSARLPRLQEQLKNA